MDKPASPVSYRLEGRSWLAGRLLYALLLLLCITVFGVSLYAIFTRGTAACDSAYNEGWAGCSDWFAAVSEVGFTAVSFESYFLLWRVLAALPYIVLSLFLVWRRGQAARALLLAGLLLVIGVAGTWFNPLWNWAGGWFEDQSTFPLLARSDQLLTFFLYGGMVLFVLLFPDGRFLPRWSRWVAAVWLLLVAGFAFFPDTNLSWANWPSPQYTSVPFTVIVIVLIIGAVIYRYRQSAAERRRQIKWVTAGFLLMTVNFVLDVAVWNIYPAITNEFLITTGRQAVRWELFQDTLWYVSQFAFAVCLYLAVWRYGALDMSAGLDS